MKGFIRIFAFVLVLLLLTGCGARSGPSRQYHAKVKRSNSSQNESAKLELPTASEPDATVPTTTTAPTTTSLTTPEQPVAPNSPANSAGFGAVYAEICALLDDGALDGNYTYISAGISEMAQNTPSASARYNSITYALEDLDGDGKQEMIVLNSMGNTQILAIYALRYGQPVMTHEGWSRSRLYRLRDGTLYTEGSGGAAYSIFKADEQLWFTYPKNADQTEAGFYYSPDGTYDPAKAQEITEAEYNAKQTELAQKITAFSVYNFTR